MQGCCVEAYRPEFLRGGRIYSSNKHISIVYCELFQAANHAFGDDTSLTAA